MLRILFFAFGFCLLVAVSRGQDRPLAPAEAPPKEPAVQLVELELVLAQWSKPVPGENAQDAGDTSLAGEGNDVARQVADLEKTGKLEVLQRLRFTTIVGRKATVNLNLQRPKPVSATMTREGLVYRTVKETTGTTIHLTSRMIDDKTLLVEVDLQSTKPVSLATDPVVSGTATGDKMRAESMEIASFQTVVRLTDGGTAIVSGVADKTERRVVLLRGKVN